MGKRKWTLEKVKNYCNELGYEVLDDIYINVSTKLTLKDKEGYLYSISLNNLTNGKNPNKFSLYNPYTMDNIKLYIKLNRPDCELISTEYKNCDEKLQFKCNKCGNNFELCWDRFYSKNCGCLYCSTPPKKIELGINTIWDTDRWMCDLGVSEEDAKKYSHSSAKKVIVICPDCKKKKLMPLHKIYTRKTISCSCGDGISYPEKFIISLLDQLDINYIKEYSPKWATTDKRYRYDFYLIDYNTIIECHGEQHYENTFSVLGGKTLEEEQLNDKYKEELALSNGISNYIILDCRKSNLEWIKNSVLTSELDNIVNLSNMNWLKCEEFALSNKVKEVCDYWHLHNDINGENLSTSDLSKFFKIYPSTMRTYLKKGSKLGWCDYNPKIEHEKGVKKSVLINKIKDNARHIEVFKDNIFLREFKSALQLEEQSEELFGIKFDAWSIYDRCKNNATKPYKGFTFRYADK